MTTIGASLWHPYFRRFPTNHGWNSPSTGRRRPSARFTSPRHFLPAAPLNSRRPERPAWAGNWSCNRYPLVMSNIAVESDHLSWENPGFLWSASIAMSNMFNYQRADHSVPSGWEKRLDTVVYALQCIETPL